MKSSKNNAIPVILNKGKAIYFKNFLDINSANKLFQCLQTAVEWHQYPITIFGKTYLQPRLIAWHGDEGIRYKYSQTELVASGWHPSLLTIKDELEEQFGVSFNSVLLNLYRNGRDSMGWHSDDEKVLGVNPSIASISLGASRKMSFRTKSNHKEKKDIILENGSLLLMQDALQHHWQHRISKTAKCTSPRINLTFRYIHP